MCVCVNGREKGAQKCSIGCYEDQLSMDNMPHMHLSADMHAKPNDMYCIFSCNHTHTHTCTYTHTKVSTHTQMHTTTQIMYANRYVHTYRHHTHTCHTHIKQLWHDLPRVPPTNSLPPSETPSINSSGPNTAPCKEHCVTEMQKVAFPPQLDGRIFPWFPLLLL